MSPISEANVSPSSSATPGMVISNWTRGSLRACGRSSCSSGASWQSRSLMTPSSVTMDWRQTAGTPSSASSSIAPGLRSAVRLRRSPHWPEGAVLRGNRSTSRANTRDSSSHNRKLPLTYPEWLGASSSCHPDLYAVAPRWRTGGGRILAPASIRTSACRQPQTSSSSAT
jgi:hypothetical protein